MSATESRSSWSQLNGGWYTKHSVTMQNPSTAKFRTPALQLRRQCTRPDSMGEEPFRMILGLHPHPGEHAADERDQDRFVDRGTDGPRRPKGSAAIGVGEGVSVCVVRMTTFSTMKSNRNSKTKIPVNRVTLLDGASACAPLRVVARDDGHTGTEVGAHGRAPDQRLGVLGARPGCGNGMNFTTHPC